MATTKLGSASGIRAISESGSDVRTELDRLDTQVRDYVKQRPILALLSAVAAGYLLGRVLRRAV